MMSVSLEELKSITRSRSWGAIYTGRKGASSLSLPQPRRDGELLREPVWVSYVPCAYGESPRAKHDVTMEPVVVLLLFSKKGVFAGQLVD